MSGDELHVLKMRVATLEARLAAIEAGSTSAASSSPPLPKMYTLKEAAPLLGVSETTVKRLVYSNKIRAKRESNGAGARHTIRISDVEIRRYLEGESKGGGS